MGLLWLILKFFLATYFWGFKGIITISYHSLGTVVEKVVEKAVGWVGAGFQVLLQLGCSGSPDHNDDDHEGDDDNNYISDGGGDNEN